MFPQQGVSVYLSEERNHHGFTLLLTDGSVNVRVSPKWVLWWGLDRKFCSTSVSDRPPLHKQS